MSESTWLMAVPRAREGSALAAINDRLATGGLAITRGEALMLAERRAEALAETERIEFGTPAIVSLAEAVATSRQLTQDRIAKDLAELQDAFYAIRDELPAGVPDAEIVEAIRGCLDAWGDVADVASLPLEDVMRFSDEYVRVAGAEDGSEYRIADDEGRTYVFDPAEWDYDEQADGWDGERWDDGWDD